MTKKDLEKMFDEIIMSSEFVNPNIELSNSFKKQLKQFIFETIIPEVLKSIVGNECIKYNLDISGNIIKQKAKELYGIDL